MATDKEVELVSLTVADLAAMLSTLATNIINQTVSQVTQQVSQQVSEQIAKAIGQLQSDFASRTSVITSQKHDTDIGMDERIRATGARDDSAWSYKTNVSDFLIGTNNIANQGTLQNQLARMIEGSLNHFNTILADERISKSHTNYYNTAKIQQEQRHADIATENQWESVQENTNDALAAEIVRSIQKPAAPEE